MSAAAERPVVAVSIELGDGASALVDSAPALAVRTVARATELINALLDELALPARSRVTLNVSPEANPLQLRVNGVVQGCAVSEIEAVGRWVFGSTETDLTSVRDGFSDDWTADAVRAPKLAEVLVQATLALLRRVSELLLTPEIVDRLRGEAAVDAGFLGDVLRTMLSLGLPAAPLPSILQQTAAGSSAGQRADDIAELLVALHRPDMIDVEIGPEYTHAITGIDIAGSVFQELGVRLPPVRLVPVHDLEPRQFRVRIGRRGRTWLGPDPGTSSESVADVVSSAIIADVRQNAASLIDVDAVEHEMALLAERFPVLVAAAMERASTTHLTHVLRRLLKQSVSVQDLRGVLEGVLAYQVAFIPDAATKFVLDERLVLDGEAPLGPDSDAAGVEMFVRRRLRRYLTYKYTDAAYALHVVRLDHSTVERPIQQALERGDDFPLSRFRTALREELANAPASVQPVILTTSRVAGFLRERLAVEFPETPIMTYEETLPQATIKPFGDVFFA